MFELPSGSRVDEFGQAIAATDGALWFASDSTSSIGRVTVDGCMTTVRLPGCLTPVAGIAQAPDGSFWFTDSWTDQIVRFRP
jgi:streptogramin lyase